MKEHIETPEKELSNEEIDNLSDGEFKKMRIGLGNSAKSLNVPTSES